MVAYTFGVAMKEKKPGCQEVVEQTIEHHRRWYKKKYYITKSLGLSWDEAALLRDEIDTLDKNLSIFLSQFVKSLIIAFVGLILLSATHVFLVYDTVKLLYVIAYYIGFLGTGLASFGWLLYGEGLLPKGRSKTVRSSVARSLDNRIDSLQKVLANDIKAQHEDKWHQLQVDTRRNLSLLIGFACICVSFAMQLSLQFVID